MMFAPGDRLFAPIAEFALYWTQSAKAGQEMTMDGVTELKPQEPESGPERERSTIGFSYTDLDAAVELVRGVHSAGGNACDYDQLAAELKMEAKGGGFRLRVSGAQMFGLVTYERGRISLTDLGRQMLDSPQERAARVAAFLTVPLYAKVYEQFKGSPLPPQAGLERAIEAMGVGGKVKDKARQVMLRSAKQAGFLDAAPDRLVKPASRQESAVDKPTGNAEGGNDSATGRAGGPAGGEGGGRDHPLIQGLLMTLPAPGSEWSADERVNWLTMASSIFTMIYKGGQAKIQISMTTTKTGDTTSAG